MHEAGFSFQLGKAMVSVRSEADSPEAACDALELVLEELHSLISGTGDKG